MPRCSRFIKASTKTCGSLSLYGALAAEMLTPSSTAVTSASVDHADVIDVKEDSLENTTDTPLTLSASAEPAVDSNPTGGFDFAAFTEMLKSMQAQRQARYLKVKGMREQAELQLEKWQKYVESFASKYECADLTAKVEESIKELEAAVADPTVDARAASIKVKTAIDELSKAKSAIWLEKEPDDAELIEQINYCVMKSIEFCVDKYKAEEAFCQPFDNDGGFGGFDFDPMEDEDEADYASSMSTTASAEEEHEDVKAVEVQEE